jgi:hypothetical protein
LGPPYGRGGIPRIPTSKKELMDYLENLFGVDTFNKTLAMAVAGQYLKYT